MDAGFHNAMLLGLCLFMTLPLELSQVLSPLGEREGKYIKSVFGRTC